MNNQLQPESLEKLDKTDLKILHILQENSKITNLDLSKKNRFVASSYPGKGKKNWKIRTLLKVIMQRLINKLSV